MDRTPILTPARSLWLLCLATLIGGALRFHLLAARSMWIDEAASVNFATLPFLPFLKTLWGYQGNMALYYFLLRGWVHLGDSEFLVRSFSVVCGVLTIPAIYLLGTRLFNRGTGLVSAALLAVHSFHIHWSQETRAYSLIVLLLVLTTYALVAAMESNQKLSYWIAFTVAAALCFYAHIFALLVFAAHAVAILFPKPFRVGFRNIAVSAGGFAFLSFPMAAFVVLQHSDQLRWVPQPTLADFYEFLRLMTSQAGIFGVVLYLALCALAFVRPAGVARSDKEKWALRLLLLWLVSLPLLTLAASAIKPLFYPRYMILCVPALVLLAARGLTNLYDLPVVKRWAAVTAFVLVMALSLWGTRQYFANLANETSDWRSAVSYILEHQQPGDGAFFFLPNAYCYRYYAHQAEEHHQIASASVPAVLYPPTPWKPLNRDEIKLVTAGHDRVWLVLHIESIDPKAAALIQSTLAETYQRVDQHQYPGEDLITVALYTRAAP